MKYVKRFVFLVCVFAIGLTAIYGQPAHKDTLQIIAIGFPEKSIDDNFAKEDYDGAIQLLKVNMDQAIQHRYTLTIRACYQYLSMASHHLQDKLSQQKYDKLHQNMAVRYGVQLVNHYDTSLGHETDSARFIREELLS